MNMQPAARTSPQRIWSPMGTRHDAVLWTPSLQT